MKGIEMSIAKGDRIELVRMDNDPDPIRPGDRGTVIYVSIIDLGDGPYEQVGVEWDSGRTLQVCIPPDEVRVLDPFYDRMSRPIRLTPHDEDIIRELLGGDDA